MNDSNDYSKKSIACDAYDSAVAGVLSQTRFKFIPETHLNSQTVAGIRDMNLGRIKGGKPVGAPVVRFDTGTPSAAKLRNLKPGQPIPPNEPHINIDPKGFSSAKNPHISVNKSVIKGVQKFQKVCKYAGPVLTVAAIAVDAFRMGKAIKKDIYIKKHKDEIIEELRNAIRQLENDLETETDKKTKKLIEKKLKEYRKYLKQMKRNFPTVSVIKGAEIAGNWTGGIVAGAAGAKIGAEIGAMAGTFVGPVGTVVGGIAGSIIGAIGAGIAGGIGLSLGAKKLTKKGIELFDSDDEDEEDKKENDKNEDDSDERKKDI